MGYYMRFISTSAPSLTIDSISKGLQAIDQSYSVSKVADDEQAGTLQYNGSVYGELEVCHLDPEEPDEEIEELMEDVESAGGEAFELVLQVLQDATVVLAVQVLWQGREADETLEKLEPLWNWLFENFPGYLQADDEGYYDADRLVLDLS